MECPGEPVEQREAGGKPCGGVDLGGGLRLGPDHVESARDPLDLGALAGHEGRLDRAPAAARCEQPVLHGLGPGAAHPGAVKAHHALALVGMDERLHGAADQGVARHAGELGDERRGVQEGSGGVVHGHQCADAPGEQAKPLLPRVHGGTASIHGLQMTLRDAHLPVIGA
jgi:hypothetical protein